MFECSLNLISDQRQNTDTCKRGRWGSKERYLPNALVLFIRRNESRPCPNSKHYLPLDGIHIPNQSSLGTLSTKPNYFPTR